MKLVLFCAVVVFLARALAHRLAGVSWSDIHFRPEFLALAGLCRLVMHFLTASVYRLLLSPLGSRPRWPAMFAIAWIGQVGKYLPGKFVSVLGTVWLLRREGVSVGVSTCVVFLHQGLMVTMGLLAAVPLTLWQPVYQRLPLAWAWCLLLLGAGIVLLHPRVFFALSRLLLARLRLPPLRGGYRWSNYVAAIAVFCCNLALGGLGVWCIARSLTYVSIGWVPLFMSAAALAGSLGFLAVFAPAGLGVREGVLLILLGQVLAPGDAAVVVVGARLLQIVVDAVMAAAGVVVLRALPRQEAALE